MPGTTEETEGRGGKKGREGDGEVEGGCNMERGGDDENIKGSGKRKME